MSEREEESKLVENLPALDALPVEEVHRLLYLSVAVCLLV